MQLHPYSEQTVARLEAYSRSMLSSPPPNYTLVHPQVAIPRGCLPIKVVQFHHTCWATGSCLPNDWAIFVPTSPTQGVGNYYELTGSSPVYLTRSMFNDYHHRWMDQRGSHTVGFVPARLMPILEMRFNFVSAENMGGSWNTQQWVWEALQAIQGDPDMCVTNMTQAELCLQMSFVESAWAAGEA